MSNVRVLEGKRIVLGVTGSIAAYKTADLASRLTQAGALVDVVMTESGAKLVSPVTFSSLTGRKAYQDHDLWDGSEHVIHIELGEQNDHFLIAPATANTIGKLAHGISDNLLTVTALASRTPVIVAPAMDGGMYAHPGTQANLKVLEERGAIILGPEGGHLASGLEGKGRMLEPETLMGHLRMLAGQGGRLSGKKVVITAGGTQEALDPVRQITNRSSGKQGYALAQAALDLGAQVSLISGPTCLEPPVGVQFLPVITAQMMKRAVLDEVQHADILVMAAAVADFKPVERFQEKIKKESFVDTTLELSRTGDILKAVAEQKDSGSLGPRITVGFAAESENLMENAETKLEDKAVEMIVANDISREDVGFGADQNQVTILWADGRVEQLPIMDKFEVAWEVLGRAAELLASGS